MAKITSIVRSKSKPQSYVFSLSAGAGSYRHIQIDAKATLLDLHEAIGAAFGFYDDHAHAFFMNNRIWDDQEAYYAELIEDEERYTKDYTLAQLRLAVGHKFIYVFDFGEEWRFACRLLKILDVETEEAVVIRTKGKLPYLENFYDEDEEFDEDEEERDE